MINRTSTLESIEEIIRNLQSREEQGLDNMFGQNSTELRAICSKLGSSKSDDEFERILKTDFMEFLESFGKSANDGLVENANELEKMIQSLDALSRSIEELNHDSLDSVIRDIINYLTYYQIRVRGIASFRF